MDHSAFLRLQPDGNGVKVLATPGRGNAYRGNRIKTNHIFGHTLGGQVARSVPREVADISVPFELKRSNIGHGLLIAQGDEQISARFRGQRDLNFLVVFTRCGLDLDLRRGAVQRPELCQDRYQCQKNGHKQENLASHQASFAVLAS